MTKNENIYSNGNINIADYDIVYDAPEEFKNNLFNECTKENTANKNKKFSFYENNKNENEKNDSRNVRNNSNSRYNNTENYISHSSESVFACENLDNGKKINITKSGKIFIVSYLILMAIIIILVVMSVSMGGFSLASSGNDGKLENKNYAVYTLDDDYYNNLKEIEYKNVESDKLIILTPQTDNNENTSWFDNLCDSIENLVGG